MTAAAQFEFAIDVEGLNKHFDGKHVVKDVPLRVRRGRDFRISRTEWKRKDDDDPDDVRTAEARLRVGVVPGARHSQGERGDQAPRGIHDAAVLILGGPNRSRRTWTLWRGCTSFAIERPQFGNRLQTWG